MTCLHTLLYFTVARLGERVRSSTMMALGVPVTVARAVPTAAAATPARVRCVHLLHLRPACVATPSLRSALLQRQPRLRALCWRTNWI